MWNSDLRPAPSSFRERDDVVKDLIEKCLQLYMNLDEVMASLSESFNIEPHLTFIVWKQLEKDNPQFFRDYYIRLKLIKQITQFNRLLQQQQQYELMLYGKVTSPLTEPSPDIAGGIYQQQHSNAVTVQHSQHGGDVLGSLHGEHSASNAAAMAAAMGRPVQPHSLNSNNQREFPTFASSERSMPSSSCLPLDSPGEYKQGAASSVDIQNQGRLSLLNNPASSSSPDHGETEANQLNFVDFLLDSPDHHRARAGGLPDAPSESHPEAQTPGETN